MTQHRFASLVEPMQDSTPSMQPNIVQGFTAVPCALLQQSTMEMRAWQCQLYQWAFERAQAVVARSWIERDVLAIWN